MPTLVKRHQKWNKGQRSSWPLKDGTGSSALTKIPLKSKFCSIPGIFEPDLDRFPNLSQKDSSFEKSGHVINQLTGGAF